MATTFESLTLKVESASTTKKAIFKESPQFEQTMNYSVFSLLNCNRLIDREHVEHLKKEIHNNNLCPYHPIAVDLYGRVWDGQHRAMACIELGYPIYYVVHPFNSLEILPLLNSTSRVWKAEDYLRFFAQRGNPIYTEYEAYCKRARKISKKLTPSSLQSMYFKVNSPSAILKDSTNNFSRAKNIKLNENREELLNWVEFAVRHGVDVSKSHFIYAFKEFVVGKSDIDIEDTIFAIQLHQHSWKGTGRRFFKDAINNLYTQEVLRNRIPTTHEVSISKSEVAVAIR